MQRTTADRDPRYMSSGAPQTPPNGRCPRRQVKQMAGRRESCGGIADTAPLLAGPQSLQFAFVYCGPRRGERGSGHGPQRLLLPTHRLQVGDGRPRIAVLLPHPLMETPPHLHPPCPPFALPGLALALTPSSSSSSSSSPPSSPCPRAGASPCLLLILGRSRRSTHWA